jgi:hypothetical protein
MNEQKKLMKEILRLKSLCRRAAEEIAYLDDLLTKAASGEETLFIKKDALCSGWSSVNLLSRLAGRLSGGYIENYPDILQELTALENESSPEFFETKENVDSQIAFLKSSTEKKK